MQLYKASQQWAERPPDERFWTVRELLDACASYRQRSVVKTVPYATLKAKALPNGSPKGAVALVGPADNPAYLTHWAFGQLCARAGAPASFLRELPATLAAECVNDRLVARAKDAKTDDQAALLLHPNGGLLCRAMVSTDYTRIWNDDVAKRLMRLAEEGGWRVPPARPVSIDVAGARPATEADLLLTSSAGGGLSINVGDMIGPAGLYASDHDLFAFMVHEENVVEVPGEVLRRGFFVWNSEVGAVSFGIQTFSYDAICGNHIVWGAKQVQELRIRHVGNADARAFHELTVELKRYADTETGAERERILRARAYELGKDKDAVLDRIFGLRIAGLSRKRTGEAYDLAEQFADIHGAPTSAWGMASGLTRLSQTLPYTDDRVAMDRAAGKVLDVVF